MKGDQLSSEDFEDDVSLGEKKEKGKRKVKEFIEEEYAGVKTMSRKEKKRSNRKINEWYLLKINL